MDRDTWHKHRFVTQPSSERTFFLEPTNPPSYPDQWRHAGFERLAHYSSALDSDLTRADERVAGVETRLAERGITIRHLDPSAYESDLVLIHSVSLVAFAENPLYSPISVDDFLALHRPLLDIVVPDLVLIAEQRDAPIGFAFALPDLAQKARRLSLDTAIIKSIAVLPGREYAGLGLALAQRVRTKARELGYTRMIHALMHDSDNSHNLSSQYAEPIRGYTLFGKRLGG
jgi:GNAT superfamily N-acetyltransferase